MEITIARQAGFCSGVKRAVEQAFSALNNPDIKTPVYSLGHLVHNSFVVNNLANKGVILVNDINEIPTAGTVIISAHGVSPEVLNLAKEKNLDVINTTCTQVLKVQKLATKLATEGYHVIIVGDKDHPEVKAVTKWAGKKVSVISSTEEALKIDFSNKLGVISQTTISFALFEKISSIIKEKAVSETQIIKTICTATSLRQEAAIELAAIVEIMLIIGDAKSANTKRLYELSKQIQPDSYLVSEVKDIKKEWFPGKNKVGITAGASTPDGIINSIINCVKGY